MTPLSTTIETSAAAILDAAAILPPEVVFRDPGLERV
jgi:hypothetical protein